MSILKAHVSLNVSRIQDSIAFYEKLFGVAPVKLRPGYAKFDLAVPPLNLTMEEAPRTGVNAGHFGIQVDRTQDVLDAKRRFEAVGLATHSEDDVSCCHAVQDKVWVADPDGNSWEVFVVKGDVPLLTKPSAPESADAPSGGCCATTPPLHDAR
jgi:catechol 2,3-dioxygenase-like lactoylglutathione lyase family enzyme